MEDGIYFNTSGIARCAMDHIAMNPVGFNVNTHWGVNAVRQETTRADEHRFTFEYHEVGLVGYRHRIAKCVNVTRQCIAKSSSSVIMGLNGAGVARGFVGRVLFDIVLLAGTQKKDDGKEVSHAPKV